MTKRHIIGDSFIDILHDHQLKKKNEHIRSALVSKMMGLITKVDLQKYVLSAEKVFSVLP